MAKQEQAQFVVTSRVKEHIAGNEMRTGGEFVDALNAKVEELLDAAIKRCADNNRKTLQPSDL